MKTATTETVIPDHLFDVFNGFVNAHTYTVNGVAYYNSDRLPITTEELKCIFMESDYNR